MNDSENRCEWGKWEMGAIAREVARAEFDARRLHIASELYRRGAESAAEELKQTDWLEDELLDVRPMDREFVANEAGHEHPFLSRLTTVQLWSQVDLVMRGVAARILEGHEPAWEGSKTRKLKVAARSIALAWEPESELGRLAADALMREFNDLSSFRRLVRMLEELQFKPIPSPAAHDLLVELAEIRHLIVHNDSMADERCRRVLNGDDAMLGKEAWVTHYRWLAYYWAFRDLLAAISEMLVNVNPDHFHDVDKTRREAAHARALIETSLTSSVEISESPFTL